MYFYNGITNSFPGGLFTSVCIVSMFDTRPFEHELFDRVARAFPSVKSLTVRNRMPQEHKRSMYSSDDNRDFSIVHYPHLTELRLIDVNDDYAEQFLVATKTRLPSLNLLQIEYQCLERITGKFINDATRVNCAQLKYLYTESSNGFSRAFYLYFPFAVINSMV
jgi:hypothetical protein